MKIRKIILTPLFIVSAAFSYQGTALALDFTVQPILPKDALEKAYTPLADYLSRKTGIKINFVGYANFLRYWDDMKADKFDLVMDAAHLVDYRVQKLGHAVIAKQLDKVSFSMVTKEDEAVLEVSELIAKRISCLAPPSRGNLEIDKFFPNVLRQPVKIETRSFREAIELLQKGKVHASMVPTPIVQAFPGLYTVVTTDLWPQMGVTASPRVSDEDRKKIADALKGIEKDKSAESVIKAASLTGFENASNQDYQGFSSILGSL